MPLAQTLLAETTKGLLRCDPAKLAAEVPLALSRIAETYELDRVGFWWFDRDQDLFGLSHVAGKSVLLQPQLNEGSWIVGRVIAGELVRISDRERLPAEAGPDVEILRRLGVTSLLLVPLGMGPEVPGCISFATVGRQESWPRHVVHELELLTDVVANCVARGRMLMKLQERDTELSRSQRAARVGGYTYTPATGVAKISAALRELYGIDSKNLSTEEWVSLIHPEDRERTMAAVQQALANASGYRFDLRIRRSDGGYRYVEDRAEIERAPDGTPLRVHGTLVDITERNAAERSLVRALAEVTRLKESVQAENVHLREEVQRVLGFGQIVGESVPLIRCLEQAQRVAKSDSPVLILGETGTGKDLIARAIHASGSRADGPFVSVNCAALPEGLVESELFGYEKGAFTGAQTRRRGRFELANEGTIFLDEIGDLPPPLQAKLLRVLEDGRVDRLGGAESIEIDVRVIAATHRDLERAISTGEFRADLYYRISTFPVSVPPLRERTEDIALLAEHFVRKHARSLGRQIDSISGRLSRWLGEHAWPGNVRELENVIQRALIASSGTILDLDVPRENPAGGGPETSQIAPQSLRELERSHILKTLEQTRWVIEGAGGAAVRLGLPPGTLRSRMKKLAIARPASE